MTIIDISDKVLINAFNKGMIPSAMYSAAKNTNRPVMSDWGLPMDLALNIDSNNNKESVDTMIRNFSPYKRVFNSDGTFNPNSLISESYAISLAIDEKYEASISMFDKIMAKKKNIEFVVRGESFTLLPVANSYGFFGFEGIFQYAISCYETAEKCQSDSTNASLEESKILLSKSNNMMDKSKKLYGFIADFHRSFHGGERFEEVKKDSLMMLINVFKMAGYQQNLDLHLRKNP